MKTPHVAQSWLAISWLVVGAAVAIISFTEPSDARPKPGPEHVAREATGTLNDGQILEIANVANDGEVTQSSYADIHARAASVKSFAELMVRDHSEAKRRGNSVGKDLGIRLAASAEATNLQRDGDGFLKELKDSDGNAFDATYLKAQIGFDEKVLDLLKGQLVPNASAVPLKALLTNMRALGQQHLARARETLERLTQK